MDGACSTYEARRGTYRILVGETERERERPLGICKQRWEDNSKMNLIEISWRGTG